ncbi:hypothetical protein JTB14_024480 [Gonioctena quinquepunctata]|nr:hypothetical protein JTB14_024480 [Gonioctena quinquepunctata]
MSRLRQVGPESILTKGEEKNIVLWIFAMAKAGFPIGKEALLTSVRHLLGELHRKNPFKEDRPGRKCFSDSEIHEERQRFLWNAKKNINQTENIAKEIISEDPILSESEEDSVLIEENEDNNILVSYPGNKIEHKFVCVIQELGSYDAFEVVAMKACNEARTS